MSKLHSKLKVGNIELQNRLVMPPMATSKAVQGKITQELVDYYAKKSEGGDIGLVILEHAYVNEDGIANEQQVSIAKKEDITGFKMLGEVLHQNHTPVFAQINHAGSKSIHRKLSASRIAHPGIKQGDVPEEMSIKDIQQVIDDFAHAALRAKKAGLDGVEIHSAHGYLLNQFYSPLTNQRQDAYGGSLASRIQIHLEIIQAIKAVAGNEFPIAVRLGITDIMEHGSTLEDAIQAAIAFEKAGVDLLDISGGLLGYMLPGVTKEGYFSESTHEIKKHVNIPVLLTGGITTPAGAQALLDADCADLIGVGRAILKDSSWAKHCIEQLK